MTERNSPIISKYKYPPLVRRRLKDTSFDPSPYPLEPLLNIRINGYSLEGLVDSGATTFLIPKAWEDILKLKYHGESTGTGVNGKFRQLHTTVHLVVGQGARSYDLGDIEAFVPDDKNLDIPILIGQIPVFEIFDINFQKSKNKFSLQPNGIKQMNQNDYSSPVI